MDESRQTTTWRLDGLLDKHREAIEHAHSVHGLPLHVLFHEELANIAGEYRRVADELYPNTLVVFASKSNPCRGAIRAAANLGLGVDAASEFEMLAALQEGVSPDQIICNGNAKSSAYLDLAVQASAVLALDNWDELEAAEETAGKHGQRQRCLVRFRGMPLSGLTSPDQTTAAGWTKFGFHIDEAPDVLRRLTASDHLDYCGISAHIGTQIASPVGYERLLSRFLELAEMAAGMGLTTQAINIGGGYPVCFLNASQWARFTERLRLRLTGSVGIEDSVTWTDIPMGYEALQRDPDAVPEWVGKAYWSEHPGPRMLATLLGHRPDETRTVAQRLHALGDPQLVIEPGRSLFAPTGVTLAEVAGVKEVLGHTVVSLDLGINNHGTNLISPDIFQAAVLPRRDDDHADEAFLAGRLCFSGDMISKAKIDLNRRPRRGERFVLYHTGAYCADHFASNSCGFPRPAKVAIREDGTLEVWRPAETFENVFGEPSASAEAPWRDLDL